MLHGKGGRFTFHFAAFTFHFSGRLLFSSTTNMSNHVEEYEHVHRSFVLTLRLKVLFLEAAGHRLCVYFRLRLDHTCSICPAMVTAMLRVSSAQCRDCLSHACP